MEQVLLMSDPIITPPEYANDPLAYVPDTSIEEKLDEINAKLDHLLEHAHQPYTGTIHLDPPAKVSSGKVTGDV
tara:strand:- start:2687 stop:2908 length:222 start_codon:yes stop_codon:yes gene_type:complete